MKFGDEENEIIHIHRVERQFYPSKRARLPDESSVDVSVDRFRLLVCEPDNSDGPAAITTAGNAWSIFVLGELFDFALVNSSRRRRRSTTWAFNAAICMLQLRNFDPCRL